MVVDSKTNEDKVNEEVARAPICVDNEDVLEEKGVNAPPQAENVDEEDEDAGTLYKMIISERCGVNVRMEDD
ncbi:hypothetical protein HAX54_008554 [Datura stramonium]|uniref:Uncharacterized protein n=1 Tax=Datura stramonium TaxID=4076 RepID=A0ABS8RVG4_DATST|nr:hypothetical protein [Datura stramonium]